MARENIAAQVCDAWLQTMRESPDPFRVRFAFFDVYGPRPTYRETLDEQPINYLGEVIPRIVTVRRNLRSFGPTRLNPARMQ